MKTEFKELIQMKSIFRRNEWLSLTMVFVLLFACLFNSNSYAAKRDRTPPSVPTNLTAISIANTSISLKWDSSTDNVSVKSYNIYKNNILMGNSTTTTYSVIGLMSLSTYNFYVRALDSVGNISGISNTINVTTLSPPIPISTPTSTPEPTPVPIPTATPKPISTAIPTPTPIPTKTTKIVGYYAAWSAYSGFTPDKIDGSKLTHINYAFANIGSDLKIAIGYPDIDPSNFSKLNTLKQANPGLKSLISVGGWSWSGKFSDVALTDASRTAFADSCVAFIVKYGFDGIDIDWEYPVSGGLATNVKRPEDKQNFTLLLKSLREKINARSLIDGKPYILTIAGAAGSWYGTNTELGIIHQYLDYANIMTYDIHGTWDTYTDFNAPLYNNSDSSTQYKWSMDSGVKAWLKIGFPANKIVGGVPFYGYKYNSVNNGNNGLYQTYTGGSSVSFATITSNYLNAAGYVRYFHPQSMVPWLFNGSTFISYEDEQSISLKAQYIKNNALGGAMIWELSQDPNRVLLNAMYSNIQ